MLTVSLHSFLGWLGTFILAILYVPHHFVVTTFPIPCVLIVFLLFCNINNIFVLAMISTSTSVSFELSSNMHMYYAFGNHIWSLSQMSTCVFFVWQTCFVFCIYANNFENCTHLYNGHGVLTVTNTYICTPYAYFDIYDALSIPCLTVIAVFLQMPLKFLLQFLRILHLEAISVLSHL